MANTDATFDIIFILLVTAIAVTVKLIIRCVSRFNRKTAYIVKMMHCCRDNEYRHWQRELRCHYLRLIPFVTKKNVAKVYHRLYYKPKYLKKKEPRTDGFYHVVAPSLLSICLCAICLCGVSWAWFTSSQSSSISQIQSARYTVSVTTQIGENEPVAATSDENGSYKFTLNEEHTYTVKIIPNGTATTGYCTIVINDTTYHTPQIKKGKSFEFTVVANEQVAVTITPQWGSCSDTSSVISADTLLVIGTDQDDISGEQPENNVLVNPPVSDDENADSNAETVAPTAPAEERTTPPTETIDSGESADVAPNEKQPESDTGPMTNTTPADTMGDGEYTESDLSGAGEESEPGWSDKAE